MTAALVQEGIRSQERRFQEKHSQKTHSNKDVLTVADMSQEFFPEVLKHAQDEYIKGLKKGEQSYRNLEKLLLKRSSSKV